MAKATLVQGSSETLPTVLHRVRADTKVLIIGTDEHLWPAFLTASALERRGVDAWFVSATVAPVRVEGPIRSRIDFPDPLGRPGQMYLYNVDSNTYDDVFWHLGPNILRRPVSAAKRLGAQFV